MTTESMRAEFETWAINSAHAYRSMNGNWLVWPAGGEAEAYGAWRDATLRERERCAKVCDSLTMAIDHGGNAYRREATASQCAAAIRKGQP